MEVRTREEAWNEASRIIGTDYEEDKASSKRAGYPIWRSTAEGVNAWISDLNSRLEVNIQNEKTKEITSTNIYIVNKEAELIEELKKQIEEMEQKIRSLTAENQNLSTSIEFVKEQYNHSIKEGSRLYKEIDRYAQENERLRKENEEKDQQLISLKAKCFDLMVAQHNKD